MFVLGYKYPNWPPVVDDTAYMNEVHTCTCTCTWTVMCSLMSYNSTNLVNLSVGPDAI